MRGGLKRDYGKSILAKLSQDITDISSVYSPFHLACATILSCTNTDTNQIVHDLHHAHT